MAYVRLAGTAQRYLDTDTGETISRRQYEKITRAEQVTQREARYTERLRERREHTGFISRDRMAENKRYWLQRFSEQEAARRDVSDREMLARESMPGSRFNRLWAQAQREGFEGQQGSAWDALTRMSGARGGIENESERNKYLAVIAWYMRNDRMGQQRWVARGARGRFAWEGMPRNERQRLRQTYRKGRRRRGA